MYNTGLPSWYDAQIIGQYLKEIVNSVNTTIIVQWEAFHLGLNTA